jgi:thiol-disulfide isomerase/thioredoxin
VPFPTKGGCPIWAAPWPGLTPLPLGDKALRGKVVLVNFWTYSCINSLRELPYMKTWAAKYKDAGLVAIGVHAPEFGFETDPVKVKNAVFGLKVAYPIAVDSNHAIWQAFRDSVVQIICGGNGKSRLRSD